MEDSAYKSVDGEIKLLFEDLHDNVIVFSEDCPRVNKLVRRCYYEHLKNIINDNIIFCTKNYKINYSIKSQDIQKCAQRIELRALRACMMADVYRTQMMKEIKMLQENTQNGSFFENLGNMESTENNSFNNIVDGADLPSLKITENSNDNFRGSITLVNQILGCSTGSSQNDCKKELQVTPVGDTGNTNITKIKGEIFCNPEKGPHMSSQANSVDSERFSPKSSQDSKDNMRGPIPYNEHILQYSPEDSTTNDNKDELYNTQANGKVITNISKTNGADTTANDQIEILGIAPASNGYNTNIIETNDILCNQGNKLRMTYQRNTDICLPRSVQNPSNGFRNTPDHQDDILQKMESMFGTEKNEIIEQIFGNDFETRKHVENEMSKGVIQEIQSIPTGSNTPEHVLENSCIDTFQKKDKNNYSFWNAEYYVQSTIFKQKMITMSEINPATYKKIVKKLNHVFGDDDDLENGDATVNLEELKRACKHRITHLVTTSLTTYYKSQIKSREIFKTLNRSLSTVILHHKPFIDGTVIFNAIGDFFKIKYLIIEDSNDVKYAIAYVNNNISRS